ncbi:MAG: PEP-CTERM sorting domain-containing protein [Mariniblastus sp.]
MKKLLPLFVLAMVCLSSLKLASADLIVEFSDGVTTGTAFNADVGTTVVFSVFVTETGGNTELSTDGLIGFGLTGNYSATSGTAAVVSNVAIDPAFDTATDTDFSSTAFDLAGVDVDFAGDGSPMGSSIRLGSVSVDVTGIGVTQFVLEDYSPLSDFVTPSVVDLDPTIFAGGRNFSFTVNAVGVPEPASAAVLGCVGIGMLLRRRKQN